MCGQRPGVGRREDAGEPHGPVAAGLLDAAQIVLLCDPVGVQRVSAVDAAVPQVDRRSRQGPGAAADVQHGQRDGQWHPDRDRGRRSEARGDVAADDAGLGKNVDAVGTVARYGPAVSSGISVPVDDVTVSDAAPVEPAPDVLDGPGESAVSDSSVLPMPQPARAAARPAPPNNVSVRLRLSIGRAWEKPPSWACSTSMGWLRNDARRPAAVAVRSTRCMAWPAVIQSAMSSFAVVRTASRADPRA